MISLSSIDRHRESTRVEKITLVTFLIFVVCVLSYVFVVDAGQAPKAQPEVPEAKGVSFGPDLEARKQNTPALFEALNRYARADKAFRAEFGTYRGPQDVNYEKLKPLLDELRDSVADVNERLKNYDSLTARRTGNETQQVASNRLLE